MPEKSATPPPDFEKAMARLEEIVGQMESGQMPLGDLIERYEEGTRLIQFCQTSLQSAEKRIETVTARMTEPPASFKTVETPSPISKNPDPDVSLF